MSAEASGLAVRRLALAALRAVDAGHMLDEAFERLPDMAALAGRDRAMVLAMVLAALRHRGELDALAASLIADPLPRRAGPTPLIILLGAAQLLYLDVAAHAAIDLSVRLAKTDPQARHFSGLVNAVLRRVASDGRGKLAGLDAPRLNTPDWLWLRWAKAYGDDVAHRIATAHAAEPALDLTPRADAATWAGRLGAVLLPTGSLRFARAPGGIDQLPGFADGAWWVQDAAAAIPARLFGPVAGLSMLDLCAAPGGKTLQLAAAGASVTAVDSSAARLQRLRDNLRRTGLAADVVTADVLSLDPGRQYDGVLLDAPCSATGTIRRHPELPYLKTSDRIGTLAPLQARLLAHAARLVRPGGQLVYCTCSLEPAEGERQVARFLAAHADFALRPIMPGEAGLPADMIDADGCLRTLPFMRLGEATGLDGFFAARLTRSF